MRKIMIEVEMQDGSSFGPHRVIFADKLRLEKTVRANNWDMNRDEFRVQSFLSFAAVERVGEFEGGYAAFLEQLLDLSFNAEEPEDDAEDPTQADIYG